MKLFKAVNSYSKLQIESEPEIVRKGILIVDDSKFSRNILKDILKTEGYLIVGEAGDGLEAVAMAREKKPEYIFMDVEMPKLDGLGAISKILEIDPKIKIVMCTALGQKNIILEAAKAGAKDYILKPYVKDNIIDVLHEIGDKNQKEGQVIPFKAGKNHHEEISYKPLTEELPQSHAEAELHRPLAEEELQQPLAEEELLQSLENDDNYEVNETLDSSFDQESLQGSAQEEVLDSYLNDELQEKIHTEVKEEAEEFAANVEISEEIETVTVGEAEENLAIGELLEEARTVTEGEAEENQAIGELLEEVKTVTEGEAEENLAIGELLEQVEETAEGQAEENLAIEEIPDDETVERAKFVIAVLDEENSEGDETKGEAEPEEAIAEEATSKADPAAVEVEPEEAIADEVTWEADPAAVEVEPEEDIADVATSETDPAAVEVEPEEAIVDEDTSEADPALVEAEPEEAIVNEDTSETDTAAIVAEPEEAIANDELPENVITLEKTNQDIDSDSNTYTFLWNNRFDLLQKEVIPQNSLSQRVSFYEYAYLDAGKYDSYIKDNLQREIALGMMKAYMSLDNRLQQDDSTTIELRSLTYEKENRFFISNVLEESTYKFTEITIVNEIKYNSFKPKQTSQELTVKTGFYQLVSDFVNGKSGRVLR